MVWLALLVLMLVVAAAPAVSLYLEHLRLRAVDSNDRTNDGAQPMR